jgi:hypothetical protein
MEPNELVGSCILFCGACDIYQQRISKPGKELKEVLDAWQFNKWVTKTQGFEDYETFYKILKNMIAAFGKCTGCQKGGGDPECQIRKCCEDKGFSTCAECSTAPCELLKVKIIAAFPNWEEDFQELKKIGLTEWSHKQQGKVDTGLTFSDLLRKKTQSAKDS